MLTTDPITSEFGKECSQLGSIASPRISTRDEHKMSTMIRDMGDP
jgi:hypothetical protein